MEVMEEGNLMDRVPILLQRDLTFYQTHQRVLQERICPAVVGGKLDFPQYASFAAVKIILWWEDEYFASHQKHSGLLHTEKDLTDHDFTKVLVKNSDPEKFISLITKSADLLLQHLHMLSQESLDHADLSVLSATIGASALVRNCLYAYFQAATIKSCPPKDDDAGGALMLSYKQYSKMAEALAERFLDLHCRLLLLYIMQDAECLHWEDSETFFESERGSYCIQMWWHYLLGTKDDLWNSVPPKMARRIFSGILNESLSVLTVRYSQIPTNEVRSQQHLVDICNLLLCVAELLPYVSDCAESYIGLKQINQKAVIRDIHTKCRELFYCLLLRGVPLGELSKVFRRRTESNALFASRQNLPCAWIVFALPNIFSKTESAKWITKLSDLSVFASISLELKVLVACPEADWSFLVKVMLMHDGFIVGTVLRHLLQHLPSPQNMASRRNAEEQDICKKCDAFLCRRECFNMSEFISSTSDPIGHSNYQIVFSLTYLIIATGKARDIRSCLVKPLEEVCSSNWSNCLDKRHVWSQCRPPWMEAIMYFLNPVIDTVIDMLIYAIEAGASIYQSMSLAITCLTEIWNCIPEGFYNTTTFLQEILPVSTKPLSDSVLTHIIFASIFTNFIKAGNHFERNNNYEKAEICYTVSEALCSIDEDNKHTDQIDYFLKYIQNAMIFESDYNMDYIWHDVGGLSLMSTLKITDISSMEDEQQHFSPIHFTMELDVGISDYLPEILASDILSMEKGKQALKVLYSYIKNNKEWIMEQLYLVGTDTSPSSGGGQNIEEKKQSLLKTMFFIGNNPLDQLFSGTINIQYITWLLQPLSINVERAFLHLLRRCDFQDDAKLCTSANHMVATVTRCLKERRNTKS